MTEVIHPAAPVVTRTRIEIAARPAVVWSVLGDFARWPDWNPAVKSMAIDGPVAVGTTFRWKAGPGTIKSRLLRVEAEQLIAWSGSTMGIRAIDAFHLEAQGDATLVREEESWEGLLPRLMRKSLQRTLDRSLEQGLQHLKVEAERQAGGPR